MKYEKTNKIVLIISIICFFLFGVSFLLMPIDSENNIGEMTFFSYLSGVMFWVSLIGGIATQIYLGRKNKREIKKNKNISKKAGVICVFSNIYAMIADIAAVVSLIGFVISMIVTDSTGYICYVFIGLFVFSFSLHCICNGKVFKYITNAKDLNLMSKLKKS